MYCYRQPYGLISLHSIEPKALDTKYFHLKKYKNRQNYSMMAKILLVLTFGKEG